MDIEGVLVSTARRVSVETIQLSKCINRGFTPNLIALSPALPILLHYIENTPPADQIPLHEVSIILNYGNNWNL
jgi:hypothetical protein